MGTEPRSSINVEPATKPHAGLRTLLLVRVALWSVLALQAVLILALVRMMLDVEEPTFESTSEARFWCYWLLCGSLPLGLPLLYLENRYEQRAKSSRGLSPT
jgi:hypothetical protein